MDAINGQKGKYVAKSVLLTGGCGFIGSHVVERLVLNYPEMTVVVMDKLDYCGTLKNLDKVARMKNFHFVKGDILSADLVNYVIETHSIDTIYHFAAQTHVDNSFGNSINFTRNNIVGTHVLLESAKKYQDQIRRFIHVSTDEVYGENKESSEKEKKEGSEDGSLKFSEDTVLCPTNPYAATKAGAELLVRAYAHSFKMPVIITRGNNVYGPGQYPEKLIPKFINLLLRKKSLCVHGKGDSLRSFLYVKDAAHAYDVVLHQGKVGEIYNVGTVFEKSVLEVARTLLAQFGLKDESKWIRFVEDRKFNDARYFISTEKLERLGWKPATPFDKGMADTINWYKSHQSGHWNDDIEKSLVAHPRR